MRFLYDCEFKFIGDISRNQINVSYGLIDFIRSVFKLNVQKILFIRECLFQMNMFVFFF